MGYGVPEEKEVVGELKEGSNLHMVFVTKPLNREEGILVQCLRPTDYAFTSMLERPPLIVLVSL